jgi:hypothetical protein
MFPLHRALSHTSSTSCNSRYKSLGMIFFLTFSLYFSIPLSGATHYPDSEFLILAGITAAVTSASCLTLSTPHPNYLLSTISTGSAVFFKHLVESLLSHILYSVLELYPSSTACAQLWLRRCTVATMSSLRHADKPKKHSAM